MEKSNMSHQSVRRWTHILAGCVLSSLCTAVMADDTVAVSESIYALSPPEVTNAAQFNTWRFSVGVGVVDMPTFPGASGTKVEGLPLLSAGYGRWFIGANPDTASALSLGAYLYADANWRAGLAITYDFIEPRQESDDSHLHGLGDVKRTTHAELFGVYSYEWFSARGSVVSDIAGNHRGTMVTLDAMGRYIASPQWVFSAGPGFTWGSDQYNRTYFGVDAQQSERSGLPQYSLGSGLNSLRFSLGAAYRPTPHWNIGANIAASWLQSDSSDSPVVQKRNQMSYALFVNYLF
jgi:outer membrane protein